MDNNTFQDTELAVNDVRSELDNLLRQFHNPWGDVHQVMLQIEDRVRELASIIDTID